jgi:hypothetical protein
MPYDATNHEEARRSPGTARAHGLRHSNHSKEAGFGPSKGGSEPPLPALRRQAPWWIRGWAGCGRFLIRPCNLVGAPRGRTGLFFRLPGRGGHLGGISHQVGWSGEARG